MASSKPTIVARGTAPSRSSNALAHPPLGSDTPDGVAFLASAIPSETARKPALADEFEHFDLFVKRMKIERDEIDASCRAWVREQAIALIETKGDYHSLSMLAAFNEDPAASDEGFEDRLTEYLETRGARLPEDYGPSGLELEGENLKAFVAIVREVMREVENRIETL